MTTRKHSPTRSIAMALVLVAIISLFVVWLHRQFQNPDFMPPHDFVEYWAAGHLQSHGGNPYDPVRMYELQKEHIGWDPVGQAIMMWNPPWTLTIVTPLGLMPWRTAQLVWLLVRLAMIIVSGVLLSRCYPESPQRNAILLLTWLPGLIALQYGQIPPLMLLGCALFLWFMTRNQLFGAGFSCVLLAVKPHLFVFVWLGILVHAIQKREWRLIAGGIVGGVAFSLWPIIQNPSVFQQYFEASRTVPPVQWVSPTIGAWLRVIFRTDAFWPQWIPLAFGMVWYVLRRRFDDWRVEFPILLLASFVCAPYGCWPYDLLLLIVPVIARMNHRCGRLEIAIYVAISVGMLAMNATQVEAAWFVWVAPVTALAGIALSRNAKKSQHTVP